jgi:hypothetical protein
MSMPLHPVPPVAPDWLTGLWRRDVIQFPDGTEDRTTRVLWGQTHSLYVDLRIPSTRPSARGRQSFAEFNMDELFCLADQKGFAGHIVMEGVLCSWIRYIDYRPITGRSDQGRLRLDDDTLYEEGDPSSVLATAYREIYRRERRADRLSIALRLLAANDTSAHDGVLVLIDDRYLYARSRLTDLPTAESLRELIAAAGDDRAKIHAYLDCEISFGTLSDGWSVDFSTIPFREGQRLMPRASVQPTDEPGIISIAGDHGSECWQIFESSLDKSELLQLLARGLGRD